MIQVQHMFSKTLLNDITWMICMLCTYAWLCCGDYQICLLNEFLRKALELKQDLLRRHAVEWTESRTRLRRMKPYELWDKLQRFGKLSDRGSLSINGTCLMFEGLMFWLQRDCLMPTRSLLLVMRPGYMWISLSAQTFVEESVATRCYEFYKSTPNFLMIFLHIPSPFSQLKTVLPSQLFWLIGFIWTDFKRCFCRHGPCTFGRFVAIGTSSNEKVPCDGFTKGKWGW